MILTIVLMRKSLTDQLCELQERNLAIQNPKSGGTGETVYVPRKFLVRLNDYVKAKCITILITILMSRL